jgi:hypothetical protein
MGALLKILTTRQTTQGHIDPKTSVVQITVGFWLPTAPNNLRFCSHIGATQQQPEIGMAHTVKFQYRKTAGFGHV